MLHAPVVLLQLRHVFEARGPQNEPEPNTVEGAHAYIYCGAAYAQFNLVYFSVSAPDGMNPRCTGSFIGLCITAGARHALSPSIIVTGSYCGML